MGVAQNFNFDKGVLGNSLTSTFYKVPTVRDFIKMASEASLALLAKSELGCLGTLYSSQNAVSGRKRTMHFWLRIAS